ncbi:MAG: hypothetical protein ACKOKC_16355, partial [Chthoniobacterales bacterium]
MASIIVTILLLLIFRSLAPQRFRAVPAKLFTTAAAVLQRSGTGILPVITGHHRQDADATRNHRVKTCIENA